MLLVVAAEEKQHKFRYFSFLFSETTRCSDFQTTIELILPTQLNKQPFS